MVIEYVDGDESRIKWSHGGEWKSADLVDLIDAYEAEPVKHGTWGENIYGYRKCSVCGRVTQVDECMLEPLYLYCPYCGARMSTDEKDGEGND